MLLVYSLCLALWILFADRRPTLALGLFSALSFVIPVCYCPTLPVLTMSYNKALHMDPHVSRLVSPVTEYSANKGSSGFSNGYWPSMDMAGMLLTLEQGSRPLEDYIQEYLDLAHFSDLPDCVLIDFFCEGINQPLKSQLIREGPRSSLSQFLDYALLCVGSSFTVGVVEDERDITPNCLITAALQHAHKMAVTTPPCCQS